MCCLCYDKNYPNQLYPTNHAETRKRGGSQKHPQKETDSNSSAVSDGSDDKILLGVSIPEMTDDFNKVIFLAFEKKIATMDNVEYSNYHDLLGIAGDRRLVCPGRRDGTGQGTGNLGKRRDPI